MRDATKENPKLLGLPKVGIEIVEITPEQRKNGEQGKVRVIENANSWLLQMPDLLSVFLSNDDTTSTIQDIGGTGRTCNASMASKLSTLGATTNGIQVGTGATPVDRDDDDLDVRILEGSTAGRLVYDAVGAITKGIAITGGYRVQLERSFNNDSGGDITINETGVRSFCRQTGPDANFSATILRDIIDPGHVVVDGGAVIMRYLLDWLS